MGGELILSPDFGRTFFTDWFIKCYSVMFVFFLSGINSSIFLPSNPTQYIELATQQIFCLPDVRNKMVSPPPSTRILPFIVFYCKMSKNTLDQSELHKVNLKSITIGISSQSYDYIHLKILPTLLEVFLRHFSYCRRKAFNKTNDKINEFSNFKSILSLD